MFACTFVTKHATIRVPKVPALSWQILPALLESAGREELEKPQCWSGWTPNSQPWFSKRAGCQFLPISLLRSLPFSSSPIPASRELFIRDFTWSQIVPPGFRGARFGNPPELRPPSPAPAPRPALALAPLSLKPLPHLKSQALGTPKARTRKPSLSPL